MRVQSALGRTIQSQSNVARQCKSVRAIAHAVVTNRLKLLQRQFSHKRLPTKVACQERTRQKHRNFIHVLVYRTRPPCTSTRPGTPKSFAAHACIPKFVWLAFPNLTNMTKEYILNRYSKQSEASMRGGSVQS